MIDVDALLAALGPEFDELPTSRFLDSNNGAQK